MKSKNTILQQKSVEMYVIILQIVTNKLKKLLISENSKTEFGI